MLTLSLRGKKKAMMERNNKKLQKARIYKRGYNPKKIKQKPIWKVDGQHTTPPQILYHALASFRQLAGQSPSTWSCAEAGQEDEEPADPPPAEAFQHPLRLAESWSQWNSNAAARALSYTCNWRWKQQVFYSVPVNVTVISVSGW